MSTYLFDQQWREERARLASLERLLDPGTQRLLHALGAGPGARCLELGAGGGSIATWLAATGASVAAVDADTRFLDEAQTAGAEVHQLDLTTEPLPDGPYDLAHARLLLVHLPTRDELLASVRAALHPGGALLVEDFDWRAAALHPSDEVHERVVAQVAAFQADLGVDPYFGRTLPARLTAAGYVDVAAEGRIACGPGGSPEADAFTLTLEQLAPMMVASGYVTDDEVAAEVALLRDPERTFTAPAAIAAWGRRPEDAE